MQSKVLKWLSIVMLAIVLIGTGWYLQRAQAQPRGGGGGNFGGGSPSPLYSSAITQREGYLYVVHGNTLYKFTEKEMNLVKRVELSPPPQSFVPRGGFGG